MADPHADPRAELERLLDQWRWKVRHVTYAGLTAGIGVVATPILLLGAFVPGGQILASALLGVGASIIAAPVAWWIARAAVPPSAGGVFPAKEDDAEEQEGGGPEDKKLDAAQAREALISVALQELIQHTKVGEDLQRYAWGCLVLTKVGPQGAFLVGASAVLLAGAALFPVPLSLGMVFAGPALAAAALTDAVRRRIPLLLDPPRPLADERARTERTQSKRDPDRPTGMAIIDGLRSTPIYRRQDVAVQDLKGRPIDLTDHGMSLLQGRYAMLTDVLLRRIGIESLTGGQTAAITHLLEADRDPARRGRQDYLFVGWPGSGRTTLCNLITMAAMMHREGAVHCISPESPLRSVSKQPGAPVGHTARHPVGQLRRWLTGLGREGRIQEAYGDHEDSRIAFALGPDVVFTDVRRLSDEILGKVAGDARGFVQRLRYVVVDHPNRLPREELIRLRIALSRLRLTAELFGRQLTFFVLLPPLSNGHEVAKWLLNNSLVEPIPFDIWHKEARVLGWLPPHELVEESRHTGNPLFARAEFSKELIALLAELGVKAHQMRKAEQDPLRIAVIDAQPVMSPELRRNLSQRVRNRLKEDVDPSIPVKVCEDWTYFGTYDLSVEPEQRFDIIVCVGIGPQPAFLVSSLLAALADQGAIVLMGDSSSTDQESIRTVRHPFWRPLPANGETESAKLILPEHSEAIIAHELASLFGDFASLPVPTDRLEGVFPSEHTSALLQSWSREGLLGPMEAFDQDREDTSPRRRAYLRKSEGSALTGERYEVPWGCCSRHIFTIYDATARNDSPCVGPSMSPYVDHDRLFIDYFVQSRLRYPPATVDVIDLREHPLSAKERDLAEERWVSRGQLVVSSVDEENAKRLDRRRARYAVELLRERPFPRREHAHSSAELSMAMDRHPLAGSLRILDPTRTHEHRVPMALADRRAIVGECRRLSVPMGAQPPVLGFVAGSWICRIEERMRDVVHTGPRLVEDHQMVDAVKPPPRLQAQLGRTIDCTATSLALEVTEGARELLCAKASPGSALLPVDLELMADYASHNALARVFKRYMEQQFIRFDNEYRVAVVPTAPPAERSLAWPEGPVPRPGPTGRYAVLEPESTAELVVSILDRHRTTRAPILEWIEEPSALFDWMHANILGERDELLYGEKEHIARPWETLKHRSGDCEDHAILFGSMCASVGLHTRIVVLKDHALCEVYLGHKDDLDLDAITQRIRDFQEGVARSYGLKGLERPYLQGRFAEGWQHGGGRAERGPGGDAGSFALAWHGVYYDISEDGEVWVIADDSVAGAYLGDPSGLVEAKYLDLKKGWQQEVRYEYPLPRLTSWRILLYRLHRDELHPDQQVLPLLRDSLLRDMLPWVIERLEVCDCDDGCAACCGGLGTIPQTDWSARGAVQEHFTEWDVISRAGAYRLACALAGREASWDRFRCKPVAPPPGTAPPTDSELQRLVTEILGTRERRFRDGTWNEMFGDHMALDPEQVAAASWMSAEEVEKHPNYAGYYTWPSNIVRILSGRPRIDTLATIVHEYAHNWQWTGDFDQQRLRESDDAKMYFEGSLVTEGHARWADHTFRFLRGVGSLYGPTDPEGWDQYKTGYFLMEGIYSAFGEVGLFRWLSRDMERGPKLRSRNSRLEWPFTLRQALRAFGLEQEALTGTFDGIDVVVTREGGDGEGPEGVEDSG